MNPKIKKILAITVAAMQIPMLVLWKIVYDATKTACHTIRMGEDGDFTLVFDPPKLLSASLTYAPFILLLVACMVLSVCGAVRVLKGKNRAGIAAAFLYGGIAVACGLLIFGFSQPALYNEYGRFIFGLFGGSASYYNNGLTLAEYMFYRYPFGLENVRDPMDFWPLLQSLKYILLGVTATFSTLFCVGTLVEMKKHK